MNKNQYTNRSPLKFGFIILIISLLSPAIIGLSFDPLYFPIPDVQIIAILWEAKYSTHSSGLFGLSPFIGPVFDMTVDMFQYPGHIDLFSIALYLLFLTLAIVLLSTRLAYVNHIINRYKGKSTKKRTWILGILGESFFFLTSILSLISQVFNPTDWFSVAIPLPFLLLTGIAMLKYRPIPEPVIPWKELDEQKRSHLDLRKDFDKIVSIMTEQGTERIFEGSREIPESERDKFRLPKRRMPKKED